MSTRKGRRLAHAHAVRTLRALGRELVAGSWSRGAEPLTEPQAVAVLVQAMGSVLDLGVATVAAAVEDFAARVLGD